MTTLLDHARAVAKAAPQPHGCFGADGSCLYLNESWCDLLEVSPEEALPYGWTQVIIDEDREQLRLFWLSSDTHGPSPSFEFRVQTRSTNNQRWMKLELFILKSDKDSECFLGRCSDVTEFRTRQLKLEESARLVEMTDALMNIGYWHVHTASGCLEWSEYVHQIHGTDSATFEPKLADGINAYHPDDRQMVETLVSSAIERNEPFRFEARLIRTDGCIRHVRSAGQVIHSADGGRDIFGVFQDVTTTKELLQKLSESEERYALAASASNAGIWDWHIPSSKLWWSERFCEIVGITLSDFRGAFEDFSERLHPDDLNPTISAIQGHLSHRQPYDIQYRLKHANGHWVWIRAKGQASWDAKNTPQRMVGTVEDITSQIEANLRLIKQKEQLERSNKALEQFASIVSHDLKEPLRKIRTFCSRIHQRETLNHDKRALDYLHRAEKAAANAQSLIDGLLDISKIQQINTDIREFALDGVVRKVVSQTSNLAGDIRFKVDIQELPRIVGSELQISQVFHNLIENAFKYRAVERELQISIRAAEASDPSLFYAVVVEDNGIGFDQSFAERIFDFFERLHSKSLYPGHGIGLGLCRQIIDAHGGRIYAEGEVGRGSRFYIELPMLFTTKTI